MLRKKKPKIVKITNIDINIYDNGYLLTTRDDDYNSNTGKLFLDQDELIEAVTKILEGASK